jgi:hypothetical protein
MKWARIAFVVALGASTTGCSFVQGILGGGPSVPETGAAEAAKPKPAKKTAKKKDTSDDDAKAKKRADEKKSKTAKKKHVPRQNVAKKEETQWIDLPGGGPGDFSDGPTQQ